MKEEFQILQCFETGFEYEGCCVCIFRWVDMLHLELKICILRYLSLMSRRVSIYGEHYCGRISWSSFQGKHFSSNRRFKRGGSIHTKDTFTLKAFLGAIKRYRGPELSPPLTNLLRDMN